MEVLVTGATGFIGRCLVERLIRSGLSVTILVRESSDGRRNPWHSLFPDLPSTPQVVFADLRNYSLTAKAVRAAAPDHVFHLAAVGVTEPFLPVQVALRHNLAGTLNLLRACFERAEPRKRPQQLIVARTPGELSALNVYAASKAAAWKFCQMYARTQAWPIQGAMIFQAYGPGQDDRALVPAALRAATTNEDFPMTSGNQQKDWIYVGDVVVGLEVAMGIALPPGTSFDLGTGTFTPVADVVRQVFDMVQSRGRPLIGALPDRPGEGEGQLADVEGTEALIGWRPTVSLADGLRHTWHSMRPADF